jgi:O-methyltransferase
VEIEQAQGLSRAREGDFADTAMETVEKRLPHPEQAVFHKGYFPDTFRSSTETRFAFVSVDADLYAPTAAALPLFWDRLSPGGVLLVHDVNGTQFVGAGRAVREFCREKGLLPMPVCDLHGSVILRRP